MLHSPDREAEEKMQRERVWRVSNTDSFVVRYVELELEINSKDEKNFTTSDLLDGSTLFSMYIFIYSC